MTGRKVTIVVHRDGDTKSRSVTLPLWAVRVLSTMGMTAAVLVVLGAALYIPIIRTAATVPGLRREVTRLRAENEQVTQLARTLGDLESRYSQVRGMLGGDLVPAPRADGGERLLRALPILAGMPDSQRFEGGPSLPTHWPLDVRGIVTREQMGAGGSDSHPGLDVAVPTGSAIRAAGGGEVLETGDDAEYGRFVLVGHPQGYQSLYGHAERILVRPGDAVAAGQVIGLSGSTGNSTGPHLHFEVRRNGQAVDPRSVLRDEF